jgi:hypothetical protein
MNTSYQVKTAQCMCKVKLHKLGFNCQEPSFLFVSICTELLGISNILNKCRVIFTKLVWRSFIVYILAEGGKCAGQKQDPHPPARGHCQKIQVGVKSVAESIEWFIEDLALLPSYVWLIAHPLPSVKLDRRHRERQRKRDNLLTGEGGRRLVEEPNHTTARKPAPLEILQYSLFRVFVLY